MSTRREIEVVIAIQLGINHTSNACMFKHYQLKELEWKDFNVPFDTPSNGTKSVTTPTVALFDDKGAIQSYGYEAELMQLDNATNHLLFREFIWDLFCSDETVPENLIAVNGRQMKSIDVVTAVLKHIISHIKTKSGLQSLSLELKCMYVLTLPTGSCKDSMTLLKEAAIKAGCSSENIKIVEETVAVLQFCLNNKQDAEMKMLDDLCDGNLLVVECEENNATMSVLYLIDENTMETVFKGNTEIWKGCHVLHDFVEMISLKARKTLIDFFEKYPLEYYEFLQEVKSKIRRISSNCSDLNIHISAVMMEETRLSGSMKESADFRTGRKDEFEFRRDKCVIKSERFQILLTEAGNCIANYVEKQLFTKFPDINQIILVGEFAQSPILQNIIKNSFSTKNIIIPWEGNMAAVRGAVFFGQGHVVTDIVPKMQHTPLNNAQVALLKERSPSESKKSSQNKLCVIL